jgi:hypothetical protein
MEHHSEICTTRCTSSIRNLLLLVVVVTALLHVFVRPIWMKVAQRHNAMIALETLETIAAAQELFRQSAYVDQDGDGVGEFGLLCELAGQQLTRTGVAVPHSFSETSGLPDALGRSALVNHGVGTYEGYHFVVYLPSASGTAIAETVPPAQRDPGSADLQEDRFVCYAWPVVAGGTGEYVLVVNEEGLVHTTVSSGVKPYSGLRGRPAPGAAFVPSGGRSTANLAGRLADNEKGSDGLDWRRR